MEKVDQKAKLKVEFMLLKDLKENPDNPRFIKDDKFKKLVSSIQWFWEMLELRPVIIDENNIILGGNMRYKACKQLKYKEIPVVKVNTLTPEQKAEFIIKDNVWFGEWDYDLLWNQWDQEQLTDWGMDLPVFEWEEEIKEDENIYTGKVTTPIYDTKNDKPEVKELFDNDKTKKIIEKINKSNTSKEVKEFLTNAAMRHIVFNYDNIADFYAHSDKEVQELMEDSALVIIDYEKAIELWYVKLVEEIKEQGGKETPLNLPTDEK